MATKLRELQDKLYVKQDAMARIFAQARKSDGTFDFTEADAFQHLDSQKACIEMLEQMEKEVDEIQNEVKTMEAIQEQEKRTEERIKSRRQIDLAIQHPQGNGQGAMPGVQESLGDMVAKLWARERESRGNNNIVFDHEFKNFSLKTLMQTSAGWLPESLRIPRVAEFAHRPVQVTDVFPTGTTNDASIVFMRETTSTNNAAEIGEGLTMAATEAALAYTPITVPVRKIVSFLPVTEEQLADVQQVASIIDARLRFFVQQKLDSQLLVGTDGGTVQIVGILNTPNVQTQAKGADPGPDAIYKALVKVRVTGRASPSAVLIHPNDWSDIRLLHASDGQYIWGHPAIPGPMTLFGIPVVETDAISENTALVGDFTNHAQIWMRQGVEITAGFLTDDFLKGIQTIRATLRAALAVYRPAAFCMVTGM